MNECFKYNQSDLKKLHTKQLLKKLHSLRLCYDEYSNHCNQCVQLGYYNNYKNMIKEELSTRPHIPNKIQSKLLRKAKIKKGI